MPKPPSPQIDWKSLIPDDLKMGFGLCLTKCMHTPGYVERFDKRACPELPELHGSMPIDRLHAEDCTEADEIRAARFLFYVKSMVWDQLDSKAQTGLTGIAYRAMTEELPEDELVVIFGGLKPQRSEAPDG